MDKPGYHVVEEAKGPRRFLCEQHIIAALREGLIPLRVVAREQ
jgi:hypothetical protein